MEFESQINKDFKKESIAAFTTSLDNFAYQHEGHGSLPETYRGVMGSEQPKKMRIHLEYYWTDDVTEKQSTMFCNYVIDLGKDKIV